ncbi:DUF4232 domain-containing protein [Streptacidiphilus melanogenes]|uniref:DUF4232 domain-containing protein n=1 Tax=Streptacidiphilus melanogenes TaxID=411235 RepID=UPI0006945499|nr:DUF4232 domain-containing protein [Streptacidiphilus melanogenes]
MTRSADRFGPDGDADDRDDRDALDEPGGPDAEADPFVRLVRGPVESLPIPEGAFGELRRRAVRRRRRRAALSATAGAGVLAVAVYFTGVFTPQGPGEVVTPPASAGRGLQTPLPLRTATGPSSAHSPTPTPTPDPTTNTPTPGTGGTATPSTPAGTGGTPTAGTGGTGGTPLCSAAQLAPRLAGGDAGAGQIYTYLVVTNRSSTACHVKGYPGLSLLDASGRQIGVPATYVQLADAPVVLAPGASASDTIHTVNRQTNNPSECLPPSTSLRIYPPGSRASLVFPGQVTVCLGTFEVTPFGPGVTGNPAN